MGQRLFWNSITTAEANGSDGIYAVEAKTGYTRIKADVQRNDAGFSGRQWEVTAATHAGTAIGVGDNQFPSLAAAVKALMGIAESYEDTRKTAVRLGLRTALPGDPA